MAYHDDEERQGSDLLEGAVDEVLEKPDIDDEDEDTPVSEMLDEDKYE